MADEQVRQVDPNDQLLHLRRVAALDVPREEHAGPGGHVDFLAAAGRVSRMVYARTSGR